MGVINPERREYISANYKTQTVDVMAEALNTNIDAVYKVLHKLKLPALRRVNSSTKDYITANHKDKTAAEMAAELGIKTATVYIHLSELKLSAKKKAGSARKMAPERKFVLDNYKTLSIEEMSNHTGYSTKKVQGILSQKGLICTVLDATTKLIMDRYKNTTVKTLAQLTKLSHTKVYYIMEKYNLKPYVQMSGKIGYVPGSKMKVQDFGNCITVPIGYNRLSIVVPADASSEYILDKKIKMLRRLGVAV